MAKEKKDSGILPFFSTGTWIRIFVIVLAVIVGMGLEHYYVEPVIANEAQKGLDSCNSEKQLLNNEIRSCYTSLGDCNKKVS